MIMARNGQIAPETGHDHDLRLKSCGMTGHSRIASRSGAGSGAVLQQAAVQAVCRALLPPAARILTSGKARKFGTTGSLSSWHWAMAGTGLHRAGQIRLEMAPEGAL